MSKDTEAWMPIYIGDYLGDTQRLTCEQHGAYLLLIFDYWRNGPPPDDDEVLRQITKLDKPTWKRHRAALVKLFQIDDGEWKHRRIERELASAKDNQERRTSKAKKAAQARWGHDDGDAPSIPPSNARSMPEAMLDECPPPSPSSSPKGSEETSEAKASSVARAHDAAAFAKRGSRLPSNFEPILTPDAQSIVDGWPPGMLERETAQWRDHHTAKGTLAKDWQASHRTWLRNAEKFRTERNGNRPSNNHSQRAASPAAAMSAAFSRLGVE